eukprot:CAMPEP_0114408250 /NCGR_PEP_ID=MMETSP0102-20121206/22542_1 /TAXON_ID=38822 ORGANISM="Pteridomonas danica, Strain PT" /NCGR_SAMPLE_ID=MMETSP0102 /ASSEMBLY_ACC=CAM_ASM_000212 /LENGTH=674 /DNA_ID=CAMNT_0001575105 /DNA_START=29 /DNA_END=2051 /DNA_ORIENTATION=-
MASYKPPVSPMSYGSKTNLHTRASRESSALLRFDMRLPARVKAELRSGKQGKAVREYIDKANIRPVLVKCGRHETLRQYFEAMDKDKSGSLEFKEVRRWLPKIGMDNPDFRNAVDNHFRFMDKDGSEEIDFKEFAQSTIDAADQKLSCYADEQYAKKFGIEIYMFLALCGRNKALKQFERDEAKAYDPGNELLPFFQFERLMKSSQAVFMPFELYAPEDDSLEGQRQSTKRPSSASRKSQSQHTASDVSKEAKSLIHELSYSLNERKERQNQVDRDEGEPGSGGSASDLVSGIGDTFDSSHVGYGSGDEGGGGSGIVAAGGITENTAKEARLIFGNLLQIRELTKHLLSDLETVIQDPRAKIGPVFVKLAPFLRMYLIYYQSFDSARAALDRLRSAFWCDAFISACEAQPCCNRRGLKDFMIEPVQRVPRYELLIKEVIRYTPPGHPNNPMLLKALKEVKEVADGMNLDMGSSDSRLKVASLSVQWVGVDFTAPHRMFIKEGVLIKTDRHGMKRKNVFLLFNDLMCYGDKVDDAKLFSRRRSVSGGDGDLSRSGNRYKLRFKAPLLDCLVIDDTMVYSQHGALRLRDDTPYAAAMMNAAAKKGGDVSRLAKAMDHVTGGSDKSEAAEAWDLLKSCGASMERVLESQLCEKSFMIQVEGKTLYLTASSVDERKQW